MNADSLWHQIKRKIVQYLLSKCLKECIYCAFYIEPLADHWNWKKLYWVSIHLHFMFLCNNSLFRKLPARRINYNLNFNLLRQSVYLYRSLCMFFGWSYGYKNQITSNNYWPFRNGNISGMWVGEVGELLIYLSGRASRRAKFIARKRLSLHNRILLYMYTSYMYLHSLVMACSH